MDLSIDYATFKLIVGPLQVYYAEKADGSVNVWCFPAWGDANRCVISDPTDIADFNATMKPTAAAASSLDTALATDNAATGGRRSVKAQPYAKTGRNFIITGKRYEAPLNAVTNFDATFAEERELEGARLCVVNQTDGDFVEFFVVHPSAGVILQWAETIFMKPGAGIRDEYLTGDSKTLPAGLILRLVYHSVGIAGLLPVVYLDFRGWR